MLKQYPGDQTVIDNLTFFIGRKIFQLGAHPVFSVERGGVNTNRKQISFSRERYARYTEIL